MGGGESFQPSAGHRIAHTAVVPPILFLDIDGVLVAYPEGEHEAPVFTPSCVATFQMILEVLPRLRLVFSSTWRLPRHVNRLHEQWTAAGLPETLAIDGTPSLPRRLDQRGREIAAWLEMRPDVARWAVLDDDRLGIERVLDPSHCVFTDPRRGLTVEDAGRVVEVLGGASVQIRAAVRSRR